ncbi:MAG: hypothetical protein KY469_13605 [Actinobacteria bacterium]|nr:hypothetical protein [Actinomycetota bacterium]
MARWTVAAGVLLVLSLGSQARAQDGATITPGFPDDFPVIIDNSLGVPVIGFGSDVGAVTRTPVIFLHGNNDTPYPTDCNGAFGYIVNMAQYFLERGYTPGELWGLGYQGEQCDQLVDPTIKSGPTHSTVANVPDLRAFVAAVLDYTGAEQVDIVGHSLGTTLTREWMRQDDAYHLVRTLVGVDGPNHGILNCSPDPRNFWQAPALGGFTPDSAICVEYGAGDTPFLTTLNAGDETPGQTTYVAFVNADVSFVYIDEQDGTLPPVPAQNRRGEPEDFSRSAWLDGAEVVEFTGQGRYDGALLTAHLGIINSPEVWQAAYERLAAPAVDAFAGEQPTPDRERPPTPVSDHELRAPLPATGGGRSTVVAGGGAAILAVLARPRGQGWPRGTGRKEGVSRR